MTDDVSPQRGLISILQNLSRPKHRGKKKKATNNINDQYKGKRWKKR